MGKLLLLEEIDIVSFIDTKVIIKVIEHVFKLNSI